VSFAAIKWIDVFVREDYFNVVVLIIVNSEAKITFLDEERQAHVESYSWNEAHYSR